MGYELQFGEITPKKLYNTIRERERDWLTLFDWYKAIALFMGGGGGGGTCSRHSCQIFQKPAHSVFLSVCLCLCLPLSLSLSVCLSVSVSVSVSLSLSHTHILSLSFCLRLSQSHTHTHTCTFTLMHTALADMSAHSASTVTPFFFPPHAYSQSCMREGGKGEYIITIINIVQAPISDSIWQATCPACTCWLCSLCVSAARPVLVCNRWCGWRGNWWSTLWRSRMNCTCGFSDR